MNIIVLRFLKGVLGYVILLLVFIASGLQAQPLYQWARTINGSAGNHDIARDEYGNIYLCGSFGGSSDFDPDTSNAVITTGEADFFYAKYDPNGNYLFAYPILARSSSGIEMAVDQTGNIYLTGSINQLDASPTVDFDPGPDQAFIPPGRDERFVAKYDTSGRFQWVIGLDSVDGWYYWPRDVTKHIAVDDLGNVYLTGHFRNTVDFDPGPNEAKLTADNSDIFLAKYDSQGHYLWAEKAGGKNSDGGVGLALDHSGNAYISGWTGGHGVFDAKSEGGTVSDTGRGYFFAKYGSDGNFKWVKSIATPNYSEYQFIEGLIGLDSIGDIYVSFYFDSTLDVDPGPGTFHLPDYGYFVGKYTSGGDFLWARSIGNTAQPITLAAGSDNSVYVGGTMRGMNIFDALNGSGSLTAHASNSDMFISKYDGQGNYDWAINCGTDDTMQFVSGCVLESMVLDASENIVVTGHFGGLTDFDPGPGIADQRNFISQSIYFAKYSQVKSAVPAVAQSNSISIYPNPTLGQLHIEGLPLSTDRIEGRIYNLLGLEVLQQTYEATPGGSMTIDVSKLSPGVYMLKFRFGLGVEKIQFVKE